MLYYRIILMLYNTSMTKSFLVTVLMTVQLSPSDQYTNAFICEISKVLTLMHQAVAGIAPQYKFLLHAQYLIELSEIFKTKRFSGLLIEGRKSSHLSFLNQT